MSVRVVGPPPRRRQRPCGDLAVAAVAWHRAHTLPYPEPGTTPRDARSMRLLAAHVRERWETTARLHAAAEAYRTARPGPIRAWLADRGLETAGDWAALAILIGAFVGITVWCCWMAGRP